MENFSVRSKNVGGGRASLFFVLFECLEHVANSEPPLVRLISDNRVYAPYGRLADEVTIIGRIRWFAKGDVRGRTGWSADKKSLRRVAAIPLAVDGEHHIFVSRERFCRKNLGDFGGLRSVTLQKYNILWIGSCSGAICIATRDKWVAMFLKLGAIDLARQLTVGIRRKAHLVGLWAGVCAGRPPPYGNPRCLEPIAAFTPSRSRSSP